MLIRYQDRRIIDYGVFALESPHYDSVVAVESSTFQTELSGNIPATMTIVLKNGIILRTKRFVALPDNSEFIIMDRELYKIIGKMLKDQGCYGEVLEVSLVGDYDWSILVLYNDVARLDGVEGFTVKSISWTL